MKTALVIDARLPELQATIEKLGKRAARLGVRAPVLTVGESVQVPYCTDSDGSGLYRLNPADLAKVEAHRVAGSLRYRSFRQCSVSGEPVVVAGWEFVATLQHLKSESGETVNLLRTVPTFEGALPERFRTAGPEWCDHCRTKRARKDTYVLRRISTTCDTCGDSGFTGPETGYDGVCSDCGGQSVGAPDWQQVGRTCTQDFLGDRDPEKFLASLDLLLAAALALDESDGEEWSGGSGAWTDMVPTLTYPLEADLVKIRASALNPADVGKWNYAMLSEAARVLSVKPQSLIAFWERRDDSA